MVILTHPCFENRLFDSPILLIRMALNVRAHIFQSSCFGRAVLLGEAFQGYDNVGIADAGETWWLSVVCQRTSTRYRTKASKSRTCCCTTAGRLCLELLSAHLLSVALVAAQSYELSVGYTAHSLRSWLRSRRCVLQANIISTRVCWLSVTRRETSKSQS